MGTSRNHLVVNAIRISLFQYIHMIISEEF